MPTPMQVKTIQTSTYSDWNHWAEHDRRFRYSTPSPDDIKSAAAADFDDQARKIEEAHQQNVQAMQHNQTCRDEITAFMEQYVPRTRKVLKYKSPRSHTQTWQDETAGWMGDLGIFVVRDGYEQALSSLAAARQSVERQYEIKLAEHKRQAADLAARDDSIIKQRRLGVVIAKYGLPPETDSYDLIEAILATDKYLRLAYYMERNRGDWSDGCDYAEAGICGFAVVTDIDQAIYDDVTSYFEDFDDGRCFRDCVWNYGRLYEMADPARCADLSEARECLPDEY